jgi:nitrogen fixation NifU-like protein
VSLDSLYQEILLEHYRNPRNRGSLDHLPTLREHENPACGDSVKIAVTVSEDGSLEDITFDGKGCAISVASASMMTELVKGKPLAEVREQITRFIRIMRGEEDAGALDDLDELACLSGVIQYPVRVKCATLAWHALEDTLPG